MVKRSKAEIRARTLLGALECLRNGITTVQDMNSLVPQDEETLDVILAAYAEIGIRVVFSIAVRDVAALDIAPFLSPDVPESVMKLIQGAAERRARGDRLCRAADQASGSAAAALELGLESVGTAALIAGAARGRQRPRGAL